MAELNRKPSGRSIREFLQSIDDVDAGVLAEVIERSARDLAAKCG